jgi:hypothetical protein
VTPSDWENVHSSFFGVEPYPIINFIIIATYHNHNSIVIVISQKKGAGSTKKNTPFCASNIREAKKPSGVL